MPPLIPVFAAVGAIVGLAGTAAIVAGAAIVVGSLAALTVAGILLRPKMGGVNTATGTRLSQQLVTDEFRKIVFGNTAGGNDQRYWEVYGTNNDGFDQIIAVATHKINNYLNFYAEGQLVPFPNGTPPSFGAVGSGTYAGVLSKQWTVAGVAGSTLGGGVTGSGSLFNNTASFTGCAFYRLKWFYDSKKLPNGIPNKTVQVVEGALVYDPRLDSTNGGSGTHRANDQTTWAYSTVSGGQPIGRNNALQMLWYLLGWRITSPQTAANFLVAGRGVDPSDIDFASFIAAANVCETEGYWSDMILSTGDNHTSNEAIIAACSQGLLLDSGGVWSYHPATNDTANIAVAFVDDDIVSGISWNPRASIVDVYNQVGGTFIDPSATSMYQPMPYPLISDSTYLANDANFPKRMQLDFQGIQDATLAQKLARISLNRSRMTGQFKATFTYKALLANLWDCVTVSFAGLGWTNKLFRIVSLAIDPQSGIELTLQEETAAVYTGGSIGTYIPPGTGNDFNPRIQYSLTGFAVVPATYGDITAYAYDALVCTWTTVPTTVASIQIQYKRHVDANWGSMPLVTGDISLSFINNVLPGTSYDVQARTISVTGVYGPWSSVTLTSSGTATPTQNQTFYQATDPSLTQQVNNGAFWSIPGGATYLRNGGGWIYFTGATIPAGAIIFSTGAYGPFNFTVPTGSPGFVNVEIWGGGGGADTTGGGGGGAYSKKHFAVTPGVTVIAGTVGIGGAGHASSIASTPGGTTSVTTPAFQCTGGTNGNVASAAGGVATGGDTNTSGGAASGTSGGSSPNGGGFSSSGANGNAPGGGGARGASTWGSGANGYVKITTSAT